MSVELLIFQIRALKLPDPEREFRFYPSRRWRSDLAWPDHKLLVEFEGGVYTKGRHTRGKGFERDCEKYNTATIAGYRVLRFTTSDVKSGQAVDMIQAAIQARDD